MSPGGAVVSGQYTMLQTGGDYAWSSERVQLGITGATAFSVLQPGGRFSKRQSFGWYRIVGGACATDPAGPEWFRGLLALLSVEPVSECRCAAFGGRTANQPELCRQRCGVLRICDQRCADAGRLRRGTIQATGNYTFTNFFGGASTRPDASSYGGRVQFARRFARHSAASVGYRYQSGDFGLASGGKSTDNGVDFGFEHTKVLSATRNAKFAFGLGTSRATLPLQDTASTQPQTGVQQLYRFTGNGAVSYDFSRTGQFAASYRRGVEYILQLSQPVFIDGVNLSATGSVSRRIDLTVAAGYSNGASVLQQSAQFDTYTGDVRSSIVLTRTLSAYLEYLYYFYDFGTSGLLAPGLPQKQSRNGIRAGLTLSTPLTSQVNSVTRQKIYAGRHPRHRASHESG